jgi:nucleotide-binding universal stress UspA family protein
MSTHGRDGIARLVLGSTAEMVVQFGRAPVLCVREPEHGAALPYRRILVPTDLSEASRRAFRIAAGLAKSFGAEVIALHVARPPLGAAASTAGVTYAVEEQVPSEEQLKAFLMPEFLGQRLLPRVEMGSAWDRINETARAERADVIVMSTHGRDSLADRVMGSHTNRVVRHASCPVLVV